MTGPRKCRPDGWGPWCAPALVVEIDGERPQRPDVSVASAMESSGAKALEITRLSLEYQIDPSMLTKEQQEAVKSFRESWGEE